MPRSYLIKQLRSDLNKVTHIESVPGIYPGAQYNFEELPNMIWQLILTIILIRQSKLQTVWMMQECTEPPTS